MVIRMRHTRSHTKNRRSHHALVGATLSRDAKTNVLHQRHRVCLTTGMYRGRQVLDVAGTVAKKQQKIAAKKQARNQEA